MVTRRPRPRLAFYDQLPIEELRGSISDAKHLRPRVRVRNIGRGCCVSFYPMSEDRLVQAIAAGGNFRILSAQTTDAVREVTTRLDLSPVAASALGRSMTGAALLARLLDKHWRDQKVTIRFDGGGPLGLVIAEASVDGRMRGTVGNPQTPGDLSDVGSAIGRNGMMTVIRFTPPAGRPYTSQIRIETGEVAADLTSYLANSEQIPTAVILGVRCRPDGVTAAGGLVVQAFPHTPPQEIEAMEARIRQAPALSELLEHSPLEESVRTILGDFDYRQLKPETEVPLRFECGCTRERALSSIELFGKAELEDMLLKGGTDVTCHFCAERYEFTGDELLALTKPADA